MNIVKVKDYKALSEEAFSLFKSVISASSAPVIGFATGSSPVGLYELICYDYIKNGASYKDMTTFNLDEYVGLDVSSDQSYIYFMKHNLFDHIDVNPKNINIPNGIAPDIEKECKRYSSLLASSSIDLQILGIGANGHIGFNEPNTPFTSTTHKVKLTDKTIQDNSRFFDDIEQVPKYAITMGITEIMNAKKIIILANGKNKAKAVFDMVKGPVSESCPASILRRHPDAVLIADEDACSLL